MLNSTINISVQVSRKASNWYRYSCPAVRLNEAVLKQTSDTKIISLPTDRNLRAKLSSLPWAQRLERICLSARVGDQQVDPGLELCGHAEVVQRGRDDDRVGGEELVGKGRRKGGRSDLPVRAVGCLRAGDGRSIQSVTSSGSVPRSRRTTEPPGCSASQADSAVSATSRPTDPSVRRLVSRRNRFISFSRSRVLGRSSGIQNISDAEVLPGLVYQLDWDGDQ